ncbi:MAG: DoxX family protein [Acidobacteriia bacterium]|nr:DoxX family protein [Terriglobia bacterium]
MKGVLQWAAASRAPAAALFVRLAVGGIFLLEGIKKFLFTAQWGAGRFEHIGIPAPQAMAPFVGVVEIGCGALILLGLFTRLAAIPLVGVISVAIASTKIPILLKSGFWPMEAEARTDVAMLCGLLFLAAAGSGTWSVDAFLVRRKRRP